MSDEEARIRRLHANDEESADQRAHDEALNDLKPDQIQAAIRTLEDALMHDYFRGLPEIDFTPYQRRIESLYAH